MKLSDLTGMISRTFDHHIDGLEVAAVSHGVTVLPSEKLANVQVVMLVSPAAYEALKRRTETP